MAKLANTFVSSDAVGNREELSDVVSRITPEDTPIYSMIKKEKAKSTHPEWEIDELAAPGENFHPEGDEFDFDRIDTPARVGNYTQIFRKSWAVSRTQNSVDNAGNAEKIKYQKLKKGIEIRKDIEYALLDNKGSVATDPRKMGALTSWYETNVDRGALGANGGFNAATGLTEPATAGTQRAFSKALLDTTMQQVYHSGGTTKFAVCSPYVKSVFTTFMSDPNVAQFRYATTGGKNTIIATADVYEGDFGKVMIVPNRVQSANAAMASNVHLLNPSLLSVKMLDKIKNVPNLAKTGDAEKGVVLGEGTLCVKNEKGLGVIADVYGLSATQ
ncbi:MULTISPECIES: DUF5309 domain-containing protein [Vibrio]|uniref:Head protein n=2 Tax=Vibrio TaxID=662 RepID=A0AAV2VJ38_9VIBR|nr:MULTISPECIES: DUF5309 domain-containing protein [Vibrio]RTZ22076.1 head protein [Vibrio penaeicida]CCN38227.1 conserved hypothetical protein [Vibrio nigripulchritudo AM115]CCN42705.1 conserved hypothetical protein [Vibrio nigripulchritudo FTn2]CCN79101.1 conserved hypothetical protein [Vibrio nigripulchritudo SO65]CCO44670.1 conserved hypothetical protein [Vibrio nigripulchritudo SOn1]